MSAPLLGAVAGLIGNMNNAGPLEVLRSQPPVQNQYGGHDPARTRTLTFNPATVVTATGRDLVSVPEADRNVESICVYVHERLHVQDGELAADVVCWRHREFRVVHVKDYETQGGLYINVAALKELGS